MLSSQRHLFSLDEGVTYLDSAALSPMAMNVEHVAVQSASAKTRPWLRDRDQSHANVAALRSMAASLIGAQPTDMGIVCSVSYAIAVASANLRTQAGERILVLEGDHTSQMLTWTRHARQSGADLEVVSRPLDSDWTAAILKHIQRPDPRPLAIAALSANVWTDGALIDLAPICKLLKQQGTRIVLDLTQAVGVLAIDVMALQADFAAFPMYKWLLGPFSVAFVYVAAPWQGGEPLEQNGFNRKAGDARDGRAINASTPYVDGALRFDMGERDTFVGIPTAAASLRMVTGWRTEDVVARLRTLTTRLAEALEGGSIQCLPVRLRSPHILGMRGLPSHAAAACRERGVFLSQKGDVVRVSPHVFNTEADMDRCAEVLLAQCRKAPTGTTI